MRYLSLAIAAMIVLGFGLEADAASMKLRCGSIGPEVLVNRVEVPDSEFNLLAQTTVQHFDLSCREANSVH